MATGQRKTAPTTNSQTNEQTIKNIKNNNNKRQQKWKMIFDDYNSNTILGYFDWWLANAKIPR